MSDDTPTERFDSPAATPSPDPTRKLPAPGGPTTGGPAAEGSTADDPTVRFPTAEGPTAELPIQGPTVQGATAQGPTAQGATFAGQTTRRSALEDTKLPRKRLSGAAIAFIVLAVLVAAAIIALVVVLQLRNSSGLPIGAQSSPTTTPVQTQPAAPPTPTTQPVPQETAPQTPPPSFTTLKVPQTERACSRDGGDNGGGDGGDGGGDDGNGGGGRGGRSSADADIQVTWATANAAEVWIVQGTSDAADAQFMQLPTSGNQTDFPHPITYDCSQASTTFTMTLVGQNGDHVSQSWTVINRSNRF